MSVDKEEVRNLLECLAKTKELEASLIRRLWVMLEGEFEETDDELEIDRYVNEGGSE